MTQKAGERTLLTSVLLSAPGPIVLGIGLLQGRSATQLADLIRRTVELLSIVISYSVYRTVHGNKDMGADRSDRLERSASIGAGVAMCLSGIIMMLIALLYPVERGGSVVLGLAVAILGATTNLWFWLRYSRLGRAQPGRILDTQRRLYRAKTFVDICVTAALAAVTIYPGSSVVRWIDLGGSIVVAFYLLISGVQTLHASGKKWSNV